MKTATRTQVLMVSTLLKVLEFHQNKLIDIYGGPQVHSEFQTTLSILNLTPIS